MGPGTASYCIPWPLGAAHCLPFNSTWQAFFDRRVLIMLYLIRVGKGNVDNNQLSFRFYQRVLLTAQMCPPY